jgi:hypothetical protein
MQWSPPHRRLSVAAAGFTLAVVAAAPAAAHAGSLRGAAAGSLRVPTWLFLLTGGGVVGVSFLLASFVTDRSFVRAVHEWGRSFPAPGTVGRYLARLLGLVALGAVLVVGFVGPVTGVRNLAILLVWVVFWGGYIAATYVVGDAWPALNPFRTVADLLPTLGVDYPERLGAWPSVAALLGLIWVEVVSPIADDPRLLATLVGAYGALTVAGAVAVGSDVWFDRVDPVSRALRYYGRVAPLERTPSGLRFRLPGAALYESRLVTGPDEVAFVVAVLFVTTYDGFVATDLWGTVARTLVDAGAPPVAVYLGAYLGGFALFLGVYRLAARSSRRTAESYLSPGLLARRFAPSLLAIAAGYHLAHNLGALLVLLPTVLVVAADPLAPPQNPPQLAGLPGWFGGVELAAVLLGHVVAVWVAHATAYELFPGRLQAIRSQYGVTVAMVCYTMVSLWVVAAPYAPPPFIAS